MAKKKRCDVSEQGSRRALEYTLSVIRFTKSAVPVDIALVALGSLEGLVCIVRVSFSVTSHCATPLLTRGGRIH